MEKLCLKQLTDARSFAISGLIWGCTCVFLVPAKLRDVWMLEKYVCKSKDNFDRCSSIGRFCRVVSRYTEKNFFKHIRYCISRVFIVSPTSPQINYKVSLFHFAVYYVRPLINPTIKSKFSAPLSQSMSSSLSIVSCSIMSWMVVIIYSTQGWLSIFCYTAVKRSIPGFFGTKCNYCM